MSAEVLSAYTGAVPASESANSRILGSDIQTLCFIKGLGHTLYP